MSKVKSVKLPDGSIILMEVDESVELPDNIAMGNNSSDDDDDDGFISKGAGLEAAAEKVQDLGDTLKNLANYTVGAFQDIGGANVEKINLEFSIKLAGSVGIPYITKGTAEGSIKINVECKL